MSWGITTTTAQYLKETLPTYWLKKRYNQAFGPNYYSFNIGKAHYVVLDNIVYKNTPNAKKTNNISGKRDYDK
jgi:hypothetical protein